MAKTNAKCHQNNYPFSDSHHSNFFLSATFCIHNGKNRQIDEKGDLPVAQSIHSYQWEFSLAVGSAIVNVLKMAKIALF